ncbi:MAG: Undecaprenyl-diphosphatase [Candidatus Woesebacteria bacterium GW2011_GWA2_40_7b]|uniref:Undecaprenyl-diphosphatase n=1 Tax=Candidatus Woesebacteria bacterium GW2011_GWA2_40_7b TaxID=1618563 RepID=A0A0G0T5M2_9BACT|nr:MAG: Undecaprenyl-diphosphatase [Candidatus Woesebacteria bacterium GW2011_GWA2_40_7b]
MNLIHVFLLSLTEGLTEFLPISSTGHMILMSKLLGITETNFVKTFEIVIQLGAIMAVVVLYFKRLVTGSDLVKKLFVAFIPTAIVGFTLYPLIKEVLLGSSAITLNALFWGGIAIIFVEKILKKSAATIVGGLLTGLNRKTATEFSFLLAVPTMFAATGLDIYKSRHMITQGGFLTLFMGTIFSFFFAMLAIKFLINYVKKHNLTAFGIYRIVLAVLFWLFVK